MYGMAGPGLECPPKRVDILESEQMRGLFYCQPRDLEILPRQIDPQGVNQPFVGQSFFLQVPTQRTRTHVQLRCEFINMGNAMHLAKQ